MKYLIYSFPIFIFFISCKKNSTKDASGFVEYTIRQGQHSSDQSKYVTTSYSELKFIVRFDSTAIYQPKIAGNQFDINKLYGFSDNNADHQQFSARFGWRWSGNALRMFAYDYNYGIRDSAQLGVINIGVEYNCSIKVTSNKYIFSLNSFVDSLDRRSTTPLAVGYKLYPYFGDDETAPHDIHIWIKE